MKRWVQALTEDLHRAIADPKADLDVLRGLIEEGADPNGKVWIDKDVGRDMLGDAETVRVQEPVIEIAAEAGKRAVVRFLVAAGAKGGPEVRKMYRSILWRATVSTDPEAVESALEEAERASVPLEPVDLAHHDPTVFRTAIERRWRLHPESATPESRRKELTACLFRAPLETMRYLLAHGADADAFDPGARGEQAISPLHAALGSSFDPDRIRLLLEHGARTTYVLAGGRRVTARELAKARLHPADLSYLAELFPAFRE
jgi:hypothetical protein